MASKLDNPYVVDPNQSLATEDLAKASGSDELDTREANPFEAPAHTTTEVDPEDSWRDPDCRLRYAILDVPSWWECALLGAQQYLTMLGSTVLIPFLIVPKMGGTQEDLARVISTIFFYSGIVTLIQTFIGDRLPIIQGGSFAFLTPVIIIASTIKAANPEWAAQDSTEPNHERFLYTMRVVSGGIAGSAFVIAGLGGFGIIHLILRYISPITVAANIATVGLSLYQSGFSTVCSCPQMGLPMIASIFLFSQYMRNVTIPVPYLGRLRLFEMFPVILAIALNWIIAIIVEESGHYDSFNEATQKACTTHSHVISPTPWIRFPYPGQWGGPIFETYAVVACLAGSLCAMVESLGDYYAAAKISGAPVPPPSVLNRAVFIQGLSCVITGFGGTGSGTTAYNENIGAMQITRVASRRVIQVGAGIAIFVGLLGKIGAVFASMPSPIVSGLWVIMFSLIVGVGIAQIQFTDQNSPRNLLILGFALYMGLAIPYYFQYYDPTGKEAYFPIQTGDQDFNNVFNIIFLTGAAVALIITMFLDNTIPGTIQERGLHVWMQFGQAKSDWWADDRLNKVYGWPFNMSRRFGMAIKPLTQRRDAFFDAFVAAVHKPLHAFMSCITCGKRQDHAASMERMESSRL